LLGVAGRRDGVVEVGSGKVGDMRGAVLNTFVMNFILRIVISLAVGMLRQELSVVSVHLGFEAAYHNFVHSALFHVFSQSSVPF